jgi:hypothetical protein
MTVKIVVPVFASRVLCGFIALAASPRIEGATMAAPRSARKDCPEFGQMHLILARPGAIGVGPPILPEAALPRRHNPCK